MTTAAVGLVGFGTVGTGVAMILLERGDSIRRKTGLDIRLKAVCDIDTTRDRGIALPAGVLSDDLSRILNDPEITVAIELIGGTTVAKDVVLKLLAAGKDVVTANKALLAEHGRELFQAARQRGRAMAFEASVGGGIPILGSLTNGYLANNIDSIVGIVNGTCNYILTKMTTGGQSYALALRDAQKLGYAEADPTLDVGGGDSAHKLAILAMLGFGAEFDTSEVHVEGIEGIDVRDIQFAAQMGYTIKLLAIGKRASEDIDLRVHAALLPSKHPLAQVSGPYNAIQVTGDACGDTMLYGRGAGQLPTASAVVADVIDMLLGRARITFERLNLYTGRTQRRRVKPIDDIETKYYVRFSAADRPGVLAEIARVLGERKISIASVHQPEVQKPVVPIVMLTHRAREGSMRQALETIDRLDSIRGPSRFIRLEGEEE